MKVKRNGRRRTNHTEFFAFSDFSTKQLCRKAAKQARRNFCKENNFIINQYTIEKDAAIMLLACAGSHLSHLASTATFDLQDLPRISRHKWYLKNGMRAYCPKLKKDLLHFIAAKMYPSKFQTATPINGDQLDCRRSNISNRKQFSRRTLAMLENESCIKYDEKKKTHYVRWTEYGQRRIMYFPEKKHGDKAMERAKRHVHTLLATNRLTFEPPEN